MKLSEIIAKLQEAKEKYGDLECIKSVEQHSDYGYSCYDEEVNIGCYLSTTFYHDIDDLEHGKFLNINL